MDFFFWIYLIYVRYTVSSSNSMNFLFLIKIKI